MKKPYGKRPNKNAAKKPAVKNTENSSLKIRLRGKDGAPLSMTELQQGLYDIARKLRPYGHCRAKWATVYLTLVDENGEEIVIDAKGEWTIYPYDSAADQHGV